MAVVLIEGFDHLSSANLTTKNWSLSANSSVGAGRFDGQSYAIAAGSGTGTTNKTLPSTYTTLIAGCAIQVAALATGVNHFVLRTAAGAIVASISLNASHIWQVTNSAAAVIATGTTPVTINSWNYIELKIFVNTGTPASGTCELHLNGATEIASTAGNFGSTAMGQVGLPGNNNSVNMKWDDLYVLDTTGAAPRNTFLGDVRVETIYPTSDGAHTQWTPNSGSTHYTQVNETLADGDTTYVSDLTPNDLDTYGFGDIDTGATVYGLQVNLFARKDDANTRQIAPVIRQSGSDNVGTTVTMTTSYVTYSQLYNQDPASADWTPTNVNADEFGIKEIA